MMIQNFYFLVISEPVGGHCFDNIKSRNPSETGGNSSEHGKRCLTELQFDNNSDLFGELFKSGYDDSNSENPIYSTKLRLLFPNLPLAVLEMLQRMTTHLPQKLKQTFQ